MDIKAMIRKAEISDLNEIVGIYDKIHTHEERGETTIGWKRNIYPTIDTAREAIEAGDMFVLIDDDRIVSSARINQIQVPEYRFAEWKYDAPDSEIMVLHTLTVDPDMSGHGYGGRFIRFYEEYAFEKGCPFLRIDTNARNIRAREIYDHFGYREVGIVPCSFNGLPGVNLVCLEKKL